MKINPSDIAFLDLFAGSGGFSKAAKDAGYTIGAHYFSEIKPAAVHNYLYNFPDAKSLGSIEQINQERFDRPIDIICFGSPCQGLSTAGKNHGFADPRSGLFLHAARLVTELRPAVFVWENVKGLITRRHREDFWTALQILTHIGGYRLEWQCVDTGWILPQHRERIYLVGRLGEDRTSEIFPLTESDLGAVKKRSQLQSTGSELRGYDSRACTITANYHKGGKENLIKIINRAHGGFGGSIQDVVPALNVCSTRNNVAVCVPGKGQGQRVYQIDGGAPTLNANGGGGVLSPYVSQDNNVRRLTPIECERLQGFPDNWTKYGIRSKKVYELSDTARYQLMGNAITKTIAEVIFRKIKQS